MFSKLTEKDSAKSQIKLDPKRIPQHIAIIMDGNGRWAQKRHLPRTAGHKAALTTVKEVTKAASNLGVKVLTLYTFSTENWKRPRAEVDFLMNLVSSAFDIFMPDLIANNIRVRAMGELAALPPKTLAAVERAIADTQKNTGMILNFALNYGGRDEIVSATKRIAEMVAQKKISVAEIDDQLIEKNLMTSTLKSQANPDLLIRTSGEKRLSNFLLWQIAYSEFVFSDVLWPDYSPNELKANIYEFQNRSRRFGGLKKE
ncbi:MAG: isoprenyl transferase [Liquorilactobacillus ghanensis]|uniref:Isoprenyl transferase n=1 Tax=Liquorilactobacillus ghanensis DSM 18630 TaxID=1423750 RepID=A0A0R1VRG8_9LACO|nr:isoprenyl transferase [Liquorilactobacillus ghanensis]KRM08334.1 di-trans-poly-cis-decaprenylcistransferase [Liquorilactobacillus ghanensis DSM 18630]